MTSPNKAQRSEILTSYAIFLKIYPSLILIIFRKLNSVTDCFINALDNTAKPVLWNAEFYRVWLEPVRL